MKNNWEIKKLGEVCDVINGYAFDSKYFSQDSNNIPLIRIRDIKRGYSETFYNASYSKDYIVKEGDYIIGMDGEFNIGEWKSVDALLNQRVCKLKANEDKILNRFIYFFIPKALKEIEEITTFTTVKHLSSKQIKEIPIPIPPIKEQKEIVERLDKGFELIDSLKETAKKNLDNAKELFQSVLREELSPKEGWETKTLGEVCDFYNGKAHENCVDENGKYHLINSKFVSSNGLISKKTNSQLFPLFKDDIVFVMSDVPKGKTLAKCYFVEEDNKYTLNQRICVFRNSKINVDYLCKYINRNNYFLEFDNGENQTNLRKEDILKCPIYIPPIKEQEEIVGRLDRIKGYCEELEGNYKRVLELCEELKQGLLREAFSY